MKRQDFYYELPEELIAQEIERVAKVKIGANKKVQELLESYDSIPLNTGTFLTELIRRPELDYDKLAPIDPERPDLPAEVAEQVNISIKYSPTSIGQASRISGVSPADVSVLLVYMEQMKYHEKESAE